MQLVWEAFLALAHTNHKVLEVQRGMIREAMQVRRDVVHTNRVMAEAGSGPPTLCVVLAFPTPHGRHVKARIAAIEEVADASRCGCCSRDGRV